MEKYETLYRDGGGAQIRKYSKDRSPACAGRAVFLFETNCLREVLYDTDMNIIIERLPLHPTSKDVGAFDTLVKQISSHLTTTFENIFKCQHLDKGIILVARDMDADCLIVGIASLILEQKITGLSAWVETVVVDEKYRGQHIAERLMRDLIASHPIRAGKQHERCIKNSVLMRERRVYFVSRSAKQGPHYGDFLFITQESFRILILGDLLTFRSSRHNVVSDFFNYENTILPPRGNARDVERATKVGLPCSLCQQPRLVSFCAWVES
jgi:hypothetical protein